LVTNLDLCSSLRLPRRSRTLTYFEAVRTLPNTFSSADLAPILKRVNPRLSGQIRSIFIILPDDDYSSARSQSRPGPGQKSGASGPAAEVSGEEDAEVEFEPPPPPPPCRQSLAPGRTKAQKRGPDGGSGPSAKKI